MLTDLAAFEGVLGATTDPTSVAVIAGVVATLGGISVALLARRRATSARAVLQLASERDALTGLANRSVARATAADLLEAGPFGLVVLELDRFGEVNESYGHEIGDQLLRSLGEQLGNLVRPGELLARWGGPQFVLLLPGLASSQEVASRGSALQASISAKVRISHDTLRVTASFGGVAADAQRFEDVDGVIDAAMTALEIARGAGRSGQQTFDRSMTMPVTATTAGDRLRSAIDDEQLWVLWTPVVTMADRKVVGVEAVVHWADPDHGVRPADEFSDLLERSGLEATIAEQTLTEVLARAGEWHQRWPELVVMVSVPPDLLRDEGFVARLQVLIDESGASAGEICIQLAGRSRSDIYDLWGTMRRIKDLGVQVALESFGTGWSSLAYLRRFTIDVLKIPAAFVSATSASRTDQAVTGQIVGLASALGLTAVAEGIDRREDADQLTSLGCELGQGALYGGALTRASFEAVLERGKVDASGPKAGIDWTATSA